MLDGAFSTATSLASKGGSTSINLDTGDSVATEALRNSINILPTLRKNQGETVAVMAVRDLDFADVYSLAMRGNR
jgi:type IV secretion system protein VirB10